MLDVHAPHEKVESIKDFLTHLIIITIGLLIATGIEGCVEWRHHVHLVDEARTTLHDEIAYNDNILQSAVPMMKLGQGQMDANLAALGTIQEHPNDLQNRHVSLEANTASVNLHETAWLAAQSSGALSYMPYDEAQRYAGIYQRQARLVASAGLILEDQARFVGLRYRFHLGRQTPINADQASTLADCFGVWKAHLVILDGLLKDCLRSDEALLKNQPEPPDINETIR